jgi:hypothetical protein
VANVVVSALATWNGKALKKAKQDVNVFDKQLKSLARTLGFTFSATAIVAFSKKAVKAFAEDEAAAKSLQLQLENTGNAFRATEVEAYIKGLEKTYAILTDLRAPFQTLLNVTGSVDLAQRSLEAALDISAGTGQSLATVVGAISAGVRGQTKAIRGLNTGIDESILATGDMNKIMEELERRFSGQAAARLGTYAGKMDALKKSSGEATKIIGEGLVDALIILSKDETVTDLSDAMENFAENTAAATRQIAKLAKGFSDFTTQPAFKPAILALGLLSARRGNFTGFKAALAYVGVSGAIEAGTRDYGNSSAPLGGTRQLSKELMISKLLEKARKREYDIINQKNNIENKNLEELKKKFDLERIGLNQALNVATDEETKLRLKAQLAILDSNEAMAKKLLAELEAAEALKKLAEQARLAGMSIEDFGIFKVKTLSNKIDTYVEDMAISIIRELNARIAAILARFNMTIGGGSGPTDTGGGGSLIYDTALSTARATNNKIQEFLDKFNMTTGGALSSNITNGSIGSSFSYDPLSGMRATAQDIRITVDTAQSGDRFAQLIAESIQVAGRSGYNTSANGSLPV